MNSVLLGPAGRAGWTLPGEPRSVGVARELARADARGHIAVSVASDGLTALERPPHEPQRHLRAAPIRAPAIRPPGPYSPYPGSGYR